VFRSLLWARLEDITIGDDAIPCVLEQPLNMVYSYLLELVQPVCLKMPCIPELLLDKVNLMCKVHMKEYFPSQSDWDGILFKACLPKGSQTIKSFWPTTPTPKNSMAGLLFTAANFVVSI